VGLVSALLVVMGLTLPVSAQEDGIEVDSEGINVPIEGSVRRTLIPIAIPPVKRLGGGDAKIGAEISAVIRRDLQISGYFKILPMDSFFFDLGKDGLSASTINFENWYNVGASGLVKGGYKETSGQVALDLRLFLVGKGKKAKLKGWEPRTVPRDQVRAEVHKFANALIEYYTGHRGIFGTRITFAARTGKDQKHVYVMDVDGAHLRRVSKNKSINILPNFCGRAVCYTSYKQGNPDLFKSVGGKEILVSNRPGQNSGADECGGKMAVTLSQGGSNTDVYLLDSANGEIVKRLTDHWAIDTSPTFSADCSQIAFVSDRAGGPQIYVMNADGSNQRRLTFAGKYNTAPDWSPRGDSIAFSGRDERNKFDIFTVDLSGNIQRVTQNQGSNEEPAWSPDGRYMVFVSSRGGAGPRIYIMTDDGEIQTLITTSGSGFATPNWGR
jgi:TolB protein